MAKNKNLVQPDFETNSKDQLKDIFGLENTKNEIPPTIQAADHYNIEFKTEQALNNSNIKPYSPVFISFGNDFAQKYDRLQKLKGVNKTHLNHDNAEIIELDNYLFSIIANHFVPAMPNNQEGEIKQIIEFIATIQKINKTQSGLILKYTGNDLVFMAIGWDGSPIMIPDEGPMQYSVNDLKGDSEILSTEKIMDVFQKLMNTLNLPMQNFSFKFKINAQDEITVQLLVNGTMDVKFGYKSLNNWLTN
jgi:hypothetical protein